MNIKVEVGNGNDIMVTCKIKGWYWLGVWCGRGNRHVVYNGRHVSHILIRKKKCVCWYVAVKGCTWREIGFINRKYVFRLTFVHSHAFESQQNLFFQVFVSCQKFV